MSYVYKKKIANKKNYGGKRSLSRIKYIVIHYTGNDGDTDENNGKYFANNIVKASAHYFVDDDSVTQSVPDNYVAWSVGGNKYGDCKTTGGGRYYGKCINSNSLSIELCDDIKDGKVYPSAKTIANAIELTKKKMKEYGVPASRVIRHFDVVGKRCPAYWCGSTAKNNLWKTEVIDKLGAKQSKPTNKPIKKTSYYKKCSANKLSLVDGLKEIGANSSFEYRKKIAKKNGFKTYAGTAKQNNKLLDLLKKGKLRK